MGECKYAWRLPIPNLLAGSQTQHPPDAEIRIRTHVDIYMCMYIRTYVYAVIDRSAYVSMYRYPRTDM